MSINKSKDSKEKPFQTMDKQSNEHIKKFKKSKGAEYTDAVKKRKLDTSGADGNQSSPKKPKSNFSNRNPSFNNKNISFKKNKYDSHFNKNFNKNAPHEKPDWNKIKKESGEKKKNKLKRRVGGDELYDSFKKANTLWEELRHVNCTKVRRSALCKEIAQLFFGNVVPWMKQAGGIRMIEHLIVYGDVEIRKRLFSEINNKDLILEITKDVHLQHFIIKVLKHGSAEQRTTILDAYDGKIVKLTKHTIASKVIEVAYGDFATAPQRAAMMQEFFGPTFKYFKEEDVKSLADVLKKFPNKKAEVMKDLQRGLQSILHKGIFNNSLILCLLKEYIMFCDEEERQTVVDSLQDGLLPVVHSKDGARIAMYCLWYGTGKQRKIIIKSFKEHLLEVATWEHANMVLMAAMDCIDDTKFLAKAVLDVLMGHKEILFESEHGLKVFRYIVLGRDKTFFHPKEIELLELGDGNPYSKKDTILRRQEIVAAISQNLTDTIVRKIEYWSRNQQWTLFLGAAINALPSAIHKKEAMEALAQHCGEVMPEEVNSLIDIAHSNKMLTYVIGNDVNNKINKMPLFSLMLLKSAKKNLEMWLNCNRGCFLAVRMIETGISKIVVATRALIKGHIKELKKIKELTKGAEILLTKYESTKDVVESEDEDQTEDNLENTSVDDMGNAVKIVEEEDDEHGEEDQNESSKTEDTDDKNEGEGEEADSSGDDDTESEECENGDDENESTDEGQISEDD